MTRPVSFFRRVTILLELYRENWQGGYIHNHDLICRQTVIMRSQLQCATNELCWPLGPCCQYFRQNFRERVKVKLLHTLNDVTVGSEFHQENLYPWKCCQMHGKHTLRTGWPEWTENVFDVQSREISIQREEGTLPVVQLSIKIFHCPESKF